jgi:D-alanine--poly(phosphoribitol) ligase subunit 1
MTRPEATPEALDVHRRINRTAMPYPGESSVKELFEHCAERVPDAVAVIHRNRSVSYRELNRLANALAARLRARGAAPGATVAVCVERSPELIASLLAVLKCGAAYLPVDRAWPDERLRELFGQTGCELLLTDQVQNLSQRFPRHRVLPVDGLGGAADDGNPRLRVDPEAIAYINFTSGSTGRPKGVPIRHRSIARLVFKASFAKLDEKARILQLAPITFDAATFEIWGALLHGGTCVLYPSAFVRFSELKRELAKHRVTVLYLATALFNTIVDEAIDTLDSVDRILIGGEAQSFKHIGVALRHFGTDRLTNAYGPTESTTFAICHPIRELPPGGTALPIGLPIQNTRAYVVADGVLCAPGETGELLLAGPGLSPGYLGRPDLNREVFVDLEIDGSVERLYRTGDRAFLREDGVLVFQGRVDDQVKVSGYRIELGEISYHLDRHPDIKQCYVAVGENPAGEKVLSAFIVPATASCTPEGVREYLRTQLPGYMIPQAIRLCDVLPLSTTGKIDRRALLGGLDPPGATAT